MANHLKNSRGTTLLELMTTVAIIAIIAAIALPTYINYTKKSRYTELVRATAPYKLGVVQCYNINNNFENCNSSNTENYGIPPSITSPPNKNSAISQIKVNHGVITAIPNSVNGITVDELYVLTPTVSNGLVSWTPSGKGVTNGLIH